MEIEDKERPIQVISLKKSGKFYGAVNRTDGVTATEQRMVCSMPKGAILANEYCAAYTCWRELFQLFYNSLPCASHINFGIDFFHFCEWPRATQKS